MAPEDQLRDAGLRVTGPRVAVLTEVSAHPHSDVDALTARVRSRLGSVSTQAVYDVLRALSEAGLVRRIEPAGSPALFEARVGDNHHHVVCRACGRVEDIDCATGSAPCLGANSDSGFTIDEAEVTYWGLCPVCQRDASPDESTTAATRHQQRPHQQRQHPQTPREEMNGES